MYQSILVPLDGSTFSEQALLVARALAVRAHAVLHLVRVHTPVMTTYVDVLPVTAVDENRDMETRQQELAYLEQVRTRVIGHDNLIVTANLVEGPVTPALIEYLHAKQIDSIVMTTHGRGGFTRLWLGSNTDTLVRESVVPVLLQRPAGDDLDTVQLAELKQILIPLDGSAEGEAILECVVAFGRLVDATYTLLRVVEPFMSAGYDPALYAGAPNVDVDAEEHHTAGEYLEQIAGRLRQQGLEVATRVIYGQQAASAILTDSHEYGIDLIAMTTHGRHGAGRLLLGSTADKVIRGTHLPVLVYHPRPLAKQAETAAHPIEELATV